MSGNVLQHTLLAGWQAVGQLTDGCLAHWTRMEGHAGRNLSETRRPAPGPITNLSGWPAHLSPDRELLKPFGRIAQALTDETPGRERSSLHPNAGVQCEGASSRGHKRDGKASVAVCVLDEETLEKHTARGNFETETRNSLCLWNLHDLLRPQQKVCGGVRVPWT